MIRGVDVKFWDWINASLLRFQLTTALRQVQKCLGIPIQLLQTISNPQKNPQWYLSEVRVKAQEINPYLHCQGTFQLQIAQGQIQIHCNSHLYGILHLKQNRIAGRSVFFQGLQVYSIYIYIYTIYLLASMHQRSKYQLMHLVLLPWSCSWWNSNNAHVSPVSAHGQRSQSWQCQVTDLCL